MAKNISVPLVVVSPGPLRAFRLKVSEEHLLFPAVGRFL